MENVIEGNKTIAEFMEFDIEGNTQWREDEDDPRPRPFGKEYPGTLDDLQYHSSWDWLMPVVEKIRGFKVYDETGKELSLFSSIRIGIEGNNYKGTSESKIWRGYILGSITHCGKDKDGYHKYNNIDVPHEVEYDDNPIAAMFKIIITFIQWYNTQTSKP